MNRKSVYQPAILKRLSPSCDVENVLVKKLKTKKKKKAKNETRVPFGTISTALDSPKVQQEQSQTNVKIQYGPLKEFQASYSMICTSSFYETEPFECDALQEEDGNDNAEDITYFGFDLRKHSRMLRRREPAYQPKLNYIRWQPNVTPRMRMVLLHWLSEVCEEYEYHRDTWNIAVNCIDRFLSCVPKIDRNKLQLIGVAALLVACKMEEQHIPSITTLEQLCDGACAREEIVTMEKLMLQKIGWLLLPVTPYIFLRLYLLMLLKSKAKLTIKHQSDSDNKEDEPEEKKREERKKKICKGNGECSEKVDVELAFPKREFVKMMNIVDIAAMDYGSVRYSPSLIAASVLYLIYIPGDTIVFEITNYNEQQMIECIEWLRPFAGVPMPKSNSFVEKPDFYCMQTSNPNAKAFLENHLSG